MSRPRPVRAPSAGRTAGALAAAVLTALVLGGCAAPADEPEVIVHVEGQGPGPARAPRPGDDGGGDAYGPVLQWADEDMLVLTTFGSSSCPDRVEDLSVRDDGVQQVVLGDPRQHRECTDDLAPHQLRIPVITDDAGPLTVWVRTSGEHYGRVTEFSMGPPPTSG